MKKQLFLSVALTLSSLCIAQHYLKSEYVDTKRVNGSGTIKFISFKPESKIPLENTERLLKEITKLDGTINTLKKVKSETDLWGGQHDFYKQYFNEVEVAYKSYTIHSKNGFITSMNGDFSPIDIPSGKSSIKTPDEIYKIGLAQLGNSYQLPDEFKDKTPYYTLVVLAKDISGTADRFAYVFSLISIKPCDVEKIYMDAVTGDILKKEGILKTHQAKTTVLNKEQTDYISNLAELNKKQEISSSKIPIPFFVQGTAQTRYSGSRPIETLQVTNGYELNDSSRFVKTLNYTGGEAVNLLLMTSFFGPDFAESLATKYIDTDNNWTSAEYAATKDDGALETHWAFSKVYDFFKTEYNRNGFDNQNSQVRSFIHPTINGTSYNAAWVSLATINPSFSGGYMFIGNGGQPNTSLNWDILTGLDVDAHEFGHGVDTAFGNLVYERESGALDEGFADIWGASVEAKMAPEKQRWIMGEDFVLSQPDGIRSFANPKLFNQPDTYLGQYWKDATTTGCATPDNTNDKCGVHTNSGVLNHWYYLLTEGGSGTNDNGYSYNVSGIGIKKAADLVYSTQASYVQSQSVYADVRDFTIQEAGILYGANSPEVLAVKAAWCAVGVTTGGECVNSTLSVNEAKSIPIFSIYPNPVSNELNIISSSKLEVNKLQYKINNMAGQLIQEGNVSNNKVNVSVLSKGTYVFSIDGKGTYKFIKN
ncbi:M4 family metallopeptidase [Chryseobacterium arthrosphaerae]|uniref:M4 family metallopeptidase n=1 Tax=Chryseobacterium arthrosphaerae TaxID=651561 RepID=UPI0023E3116A|nr:M4 family metallopeptidase [Chryseobacterium arthrosphaerae]WES95971.1 M4 family metallopeptidase [Chryseobacterium arthrosphaerae]